MSRTLAEKILARAAGRAAVTPGEIVNCRVDLAMFHDSSGPRRLKPMLEDHGLIGMVEPLGFEICALRYKAEAVEGIEAVGGKGRFKLVHDTFHHHLAGDARLFPARTGLVHVSGVEDTALAPDAMRDGHRVLVGPGDRLDSTGQLRALLDAGYAGLVSFEPFADVIGRAADIEAQLRASMAHLRAAIGQPG